jgi:DNA-binding transcriptional LysR family regulator
MFRPSLSRLCTIFGMYVTLDQARALDALDREGTLQKAALSLHKGHTAVLYALTALESQTELSLLDRSGYRLKLTAAGRSVLLHCRSLLSAERELYDACAQMKTGWEPSVRLVFDGLYPIDPVLRWMKELGAKKAPTKVSVSAEFLGGVEEAFGRDQADFMIAVLPPHQTGLAARRLPPIRALLVAHRDHPLAKVRGKLSTEHLKEQVLLTVRGGDPRLSLPTAGLEARSSVHLHDFESKRRAIQKGLGFGWLPDHVARADLGRGSLKVLRYEGGSEHTFAPHLYHRSGLQLGRAGEALTAALG